MNPLSVVGFLTACVASVAAYPYPVPVAYPLAYADDAYAPVPHAAPSYGHENLGRVKIQVYRGPSSGKCDPYGGYDCFAPWGYYNTQPADYAVPKYH